MLLKRLLFVALFLAFALPCYAQTNLTAQWDVRTGGADTNGGAYDPTVVAPGTDESQGNTGTSVSCVVQATTTQVICTPAISATTHGPGNFVYFASGTGCTTATHLEIESQSGGTGTLSASAGSAADVCLGTLGGSMATIQAADAASAAENLIYIQGTYTWTVNYTRTKSNNWIGYTTTHGDNGMAVITTSTASMNVLVESGTSAGVYLSQNIDFEDTTGTNFAYDAGGSGSAVQFLVFNHCKINGFSYGVNTSGSIITYIFFNGTEVSNIGNAGINNNASAREFSITNSYFHTMGDWVASPFDPSSILVCSNSIFAQGSDLSSPFQFGGISATIDHCGFGPGSGNLLDLLMAPGGQTQSFAQVTNSIFSGSSAGGGIEHQPVNYVATGASMFNDSFGNNATPNAIPYLNPTNINLTGGSPWVNQSGGNFALNSTSGAGALLQGTGWPTTFGSTTTTGTDVGAVQRAGGVTVIQGSTGSSN